MQITRRRCAAAFWCLPSAPPKLRPMNRDAISLSFVRGLFAGAIHDNLLFPFPEPLDSRSPDEASTVRTLLTRFDGMVADGLIDSARFDEEESLPEDVI